MVIGKGSTYTILTSDDVQQLLASAIEDMLPGPGQDLAALRVLVIIPDGTRTAPIPMMFHLLNQQLEPRVEQLDYLIALGTHPPMSQDAIDHLVGMTAAERALRYPNVEIFNHEWHNPNMLHTIGIIPHSEVAELSGGMLVDDVPVTLNRLVLEYDLMLICGPVFPHEVAGFSGGAKYLFPGIAGPEIIDFTHWLGALATSMRTIGVKDTPVRRVITQASGSVTRPILCISMVMQGSELHGLYIGDHLEAWSQAADLSAQLNITEVSYTHGKLIDEVGYHVRDYFVKQWDRFKNIPGGILAHSTHVKGTGTFDAETGIETPRISVTLATGIPEERCRHVNLGYADYRDIDPAAWKGRENEGILYVPHAGETLYRARGI